MRHYTEKYSDTQYLILTSALARHVNPFRDDVWNTGKIKRSEVQQCVSHRMLWHKHNDGGNRASFGPKVRRWPYPVDTHRIAYLVCNLPHTPIEIYVDEDGKVSVEDGNHRLAAHIYLKMRWIPVEFNGYIAQFRNRFKHRIVLRGEYKDGYVGLDKHFVRD